MAHLSFRDAFGERGATFFPGANGPQTYRLLLWRCWSDAPLLGVIGKNPSMAGAEKNDPTVRVLCGLGRRIGAGGILLGNVNPYVATDPRAMMRAYRARNATDESHREWARVWDQQHHDMRRLRVHCPRVLVAWGRLERDIREVASSVLLDLSYPHYLGEVLTLGRNRDGTPRHPLRTKLELVPFWTARCCAPVDVT